MDLNHRPPGPEPRQQEILSALSGVASGQGPDFLPLLIVRKLYLNEQVGKYRLVSVIRLAQGQ